MVWMPEVGLRTAGFLAHRRPMRNALDGRWELSECLDGWAQGPCPQEAKHLWGVTSITGGERG